MNTEENETKEKSVGKPVNPRYAGLRPPFKKGHAPPPGAGRPKGTPSLTRVLKEILAEGDGEREKELIMLALRRARKNDRTLDLLWERIDGKVTQKIEAEVKINPLVDELIKLREPQDHT